MWKYMQSFRILNTLLVIVCVFLVLFMDFLLKKFSSKGSYSTHISKNIISNKSKQIRNYEPYVFQDKLSCCKNETLPTSDTSMYYQFTNIENAVRYPKQGNNQIEFLPDFKSPCFLVKKSRSNSPCGQRIKCLPAFYVIGVVKSGTSNLHYMMTRHPLVHGGSHKEIFWLERACGTETTKLMNYLSYYCKAAEEAQDTVTTMPDGTTCHPLLIGDFTPTTMTRLRHWEKGGILPAHCIRQIHPTSKLIVILRHPVTRCLSGYKFRRRGLHFSAQAFHDDVTHTIAWWDQCVLRHEARHCLLVERFKDVVYGTVANEVLGSLYYFYMKEWLAVFPRHNFHIIQFEQYVTDPNLYLNKHVFPFLELDYFNTSAVIKKRGQSSDKDYTEMRPETRELLTWFYSPFNKLLAELLQDDAFLWSEA